MFIVGEIWLPDVKDMLAWLDKMQHRFALYDAPLLNNFARISKTEEADLRVLFEGSLVKEAPRKAVKVVQNHDTQ